MLYFISVLKGFHFLETLACISIFTGMILLENPICLKAFWTMSVLESWKSNAVNTLFTRLNGFFLFKVWMLLHFNGCSNFLLSFLIGISPQIYILKNPYWKYQCKNVCKLIAIIKKEGYFTGIEWKWFLFYQIQYEMDSRKF